MADSVERRPELSIHESQRQPLVAYRGEDGLPHPTLGTLARELRSELFRHRVSIYLEPEFVKRLDKLAETP